MLLTKEVEVQVVGGTLKYYRSLGYDVKCNDKILVSVSDLKKRSKEMVKVQCDDCGKVFDFHFDAYRKYRDDFINCKYQCRDCEIKEIWDRVKDECVNLNFTLISDISHYKTHKSEVKFICNNHKDYGIQKVTVNTLLVKHCGCKLCANEKKAKSKVLEFELVKSKFDEVGYILLETEYISAKTPMRYICPKHPDIIQKITYDKLSHGQGCKYCGYEKIGKHFRHSFEYVWDCFNDKNLILIDDDYKNDTLPLRYICKNHRNKGIQTITFSSLKVSDFGCKYCAIEYRASLMSKGGVTPLHNYLRERINSWKEDSIKNYHYKCVLTGGRFDVIHHLYGFNMILLETLDNLRLSIHPQVGLYTDNELLLIEQECLKLHYKYGLGVCLCKPLHNLFHKFYSKGENTPEQFEEFKQRYYNFEFDDLLDNKYKYKNILSKVS